MCDSNQVVAKKQKKYCVVSNIIVNNAIVEENQNTRSAHKNVHFTYRERIIKMQKTEKRLNTANLMTELTKLKTQQKYLEATQVVLKPISQIASEFSDLNDLECMKIEQELNVAAFADKIRFDIKHIRDSIKDFRDEMLNVSSLCKFNTKQYREQIEVIDRQLRCIEKSNFEQMKQLKLEYCNTESELVPLMGNLNLLEKSTMPMAFIRKPSANTISHMRRIHSAPIDKSDLDDVRRFDKYLKENNNGHTGGWIDQEHVLFIKMRNKFKSNIDEMSAGLKVLFVGKIFDIENTIELAEAFLILN